MFENGADKIYRMQNAQYQVIHGKYDDHLVFFLAEQYDEKKYQQSISGQN
jgi:hypothetical protein